MNPWYIQTINNADEKCHDRFKRFYTYIKGPVQHSKRKKSRIITQRKSYQNKINNKRNGGMGSTLSTASTPRKHFQSLARYIGFLGARRPISAASPEDEDEVIVYRFSKGQFQFTKKKKSMQL